MQDLVGERRQDSICELDLKQQTSRARKCHATTSAELKLLRRRRTLRSRGRSVFLFLGAITVLLLVATHASPPPAGTGGTETRSLEVTVTVATGTPGGALDEVSDSGNAVSLVDCNGCRRLLTSVGRREGGVGDPGPCNALRVFAGPLPGRGILLTPVARVVAPAAAERVTRVGRVSDGPGRVASDRACLAAGGRATPDFVSEDLTDLLDPPGRESAVVAPRSPLISSSSSESAAARL